MTPQEAAGAAAARLVIVGQPDYVAVGQAGYCGARTFQPREAYDRIALAPGETVWVKFRYRTEGYAVNYGCDIDTGFKPEAGQVYIMRFLPPENGCRAELFRVVPGKDPVRLPLLKPEFTSCLLQ